eukprot:1049617-Prorocentrum_minimum.AAC.1
MAGEVTYAEGDRFVATFLPAEPGIHHVRLPLYTRLYWTLLDWAGPDWTGLDWLRLLYVARCAGENPPGVQALLGGGVGSHDDQGQRHRAVHGGAVPPYPLLTPSLIGCLGSLFVYT